MRILLRWLAVPATILVVLAGLWVSGGVLTNDFALAMWLTAAWMALAGLVCVLVAARRRALRVPVLGAYLLTAVVAGAYLGSSVLVDRAVDEDVAVAAPAAPATRMTAREPGPTRPRNVALRTGRFTGVRHDTTGTATIIDLAGGGRVLTLTGFETDNGPDLRVYLVPGAAKTEGDVRDVVDLGALKGNRGDQQYGIPARVDDDRHATVVVWCRAFSVLFGRAPTRP